MSDQSGFFKRNQASDKLPAIAFHELNTAVVGKILSEPRIVTTKNDEGREIEKLVMDIEAMTGTTCKAGPEDERIDVEIGGKYALWIGGPSMTRAVFEACRQAGVEGLAEGGVLAIVHTALGPKPEDKKRKRAKLYEAEYAAPKPTVGGSLLARAGGSGDDGEQF